MRVALLRGAMCCIAGAALDAGTAWADPAVGQFEIKSLNAEPGEIEIQSQNAYSLGMPRRQTRSTPDGLAGDGNSLHRQMHALEIEAGFSHHFSFVSASSSRKSASTSSRQPAKPGTLKRSSSTSSRLKPFSC